MSAVCPSCGVAVVPGYVRCPKCQAPLPARRAGTVQAGGTAVDDRSRLPIIAIAAGVAIVVVVLLVVALRDGDTPAADPTASTMATPVAPADPRTPESAQPAVVTPTTQTTPTSPDPAEAAADLDRELKRQRLWGTVQIIGERADVRSGACADPNMRPVLDAAAGALRGAGLTKLRCLEQSGAVVFERDL